MNKNYLHLIIALSLLASGVVITLIGSNAHPFEEKIVDCYDGHGSKIIDQKCLGNERDTTGTILIYIGFLSFFCGILGVLLTMISWEHKK